MTEKTFEAQLQNDLEEVEWITQTRGFEEAGLLTYNKGLVIKTDDNSEFQISIVKIK
jgi:hypothetical protein